MLKRAIFLIFSLFFLYVFNAFLFPYPVKTVPEGARPAYGFSYSFEQARWYGYDGRVEFVKLLDRVKFDWVRLPFFWDEMADEAGNLKVDDLDFAISEAGKRNVKVIIVLGAKVPFYPEFHLPAAESSKIKFAANVSSTSPIAFDLLTVDSKIVSHFSKFDNVIYWQVENEPFLPNVGKFRIDKSLINSEVKVVRDYDPKKRPVILTSDAPTVFNNRWKDLFSVLMPGDALGTNAYFKTQGTYLVYFSKLNIPWPKGFYWPVQSWYLLSPNFENLKVYAKKRNVDTWIMEMQAEPYVRDLTDAAKEKFSFGPGDIVNADNFLKSRGLNSIGFWGANFWIFREKIGDSSWMNAVKNIVN
jgi:hypothetical protein